MKLPKAFTDPFIVIIAVVIMLPAGLFTYAVFHERAMKPERQDAAQVAEQAIETPAVSAAVPTTSAPITQAEQSASTDKIAPAKAQVAAAVVSCDEDKKQAAVATRDAQLAAEETLHEKHKDKLRLLSTLYRKYWDEEMARHDAAVSQIESTYQAALTAANC